MQVFNFVTGAIAVIMLTSAIAPAIANADANFQEEVLNHPICSFLITKDVGSTVNIRQGPGTNSPIVTTLKGGEGVRAVSRSGNWVKLAARTFGTVPNETFKPLQGWVNNQFINGCSEDQFDRWRQ
jgi:SH3-like domain-containing protein